MGGKNSALRMQKSSLTEKSMRLRGATIFCSNQDAKVCFLIYSTHRDWSISQTFRKLKRFSRCFYTKVGILHKFGYYIKRMPQADRLRDHLGLSYYESLIFPALNFAVMSSVMNRRRVSCAKMGKAPGGTNTKWVLYRCSKVWYVARASLASKSLR